MKSKVSIIMPVLNGERFITGSDSKHSGADVHQLRIDCGRRWLYR